VPTIKALRAKAEAIRVAEFEKAIGRFGDGATKKQMKVRSGFGGRDGPHAAEPRPLLSLLEG
jgi:hypothetical protein